MRSIERRLQYPYNILLIALCFILLFLSHWNVADERERERESLHRCFRLLPFAFSFLAGIFTREWEGVEKKNLCCCRKTEKGERKRESAAQSFTCTFTDPITPLNFPFSSPLLSTIIGFLHSVENQLLLKRDFPRSPSELEQGKILFSIRLFTL